MKQRRREHPERLAEKLLTIRKALGLSQTGMKHSLGYKGAYGRISEFELGRRSPDMLVVLQYARAAGVPMETLVDDNLELPEVTKQTN